MSFWRMRAGLLVLGVVGAALGSAGLVQSSRSSVPSTVPQGADLLQRGQLLEAERVLLAVLKGEPTNALAWYYLGKVYEQEGKLAAAALSLRQSLALASDRALSAKAAAEIEALSERKTSSQGAVGQTVNSSAAESSLWAKASASPDVRDVAAYLRAYPNGAHAAIARAKLRSAINGTALQQTAKAVGTLDSAIDSANAASNSSEISAAVSSTVEQTSGELSQYAANERKLAEQEVQKALQTLQAKTQSAQGSGVGGHCTAGPKCTAAGNGAKGYMQSKQSMLSGGANAASAANTSACVDYVMAEVSRKCAEEQNEEGHSDCAQLAFRQEDEFVKDANQAGSSSQQLSAGGADWKSYCGFH